MIVSSLHLFLFKFLIIDFIYNYGMLKSFGMMDLSIH